MSRDSEQKIRLLVLYDILQRESDEEHAVSTIEFIDKFAAHGIKTTRQTVYEDIEMLNSFGYEVVCLRGRNNRYYAGCRAFELSEVQILLHAIGAAKFLTEKKVSVLTQKAAELLDVARERFGNIHCKIDGDGLHGQRVRAREPYILCVDNHFRGEGKNTRPAEGKGQL